MRIKFIEISNFRKLLSIRVDLYEYTTLFVGANNSGKTSAMLALRKFLSPRGRPFETHDFTLCHWPALNALGQRWIEARPKKELVQFNIADWASLVPTLDLWLHVEAGELHYVRDLIPTLDWEGCELGVRLRFEPKDLHALYKEFLGAVDDALAMKVAAENWNPATAEREAGVAPAPKLTVWPSNLVDFLSRRLSQHFEIRAYSLDPSSVSPPEKLQARPQALPADAVPIEGDPLAGLIRVNDIPAQRGFGEPQSSDGDDGVLVRSGGSRLSDQLRPITRSTSIQQIDPTHTTSVPSRQSKQRRTLLTPG